MTKKPVPPKSFKEVEAYIKEKGLQVDPLFFWEFFEAGKWYDSNDKPVIRWKQKAQTWSRSALLKGKRKYCYCGKPGVYLAGHDDTGQPYFRCVEHRPKFEASMPESTKNTLKPIPKEDTIDLNEKRNEMRRRLLKK